MGRPGRRSCHHTGHGRGTKRKRVGKEGKHECSRGASKTVKQIQNEIEIRYLYTGRSIVFTQEIS